MTRHRIAQIGENRNPKSPENRPQTRRFLQIRLLQLRRSATPFNGLAVLHGRLDQVCRIYTLSLEEFLAWERDMDRYGVPGLRATRYQIYRQTETRKAR